MFIISTALDARQRLGDCPICLFPRLDLCGIAAAPLTSGRNPTYRKCGG
jgi:hypothetical protein